MRGKEWILLLLYDCRFFVSRRMIFVVHVGVNSEQSVCLKWGNVHPPSCYVLLYPESLFHTFDPTKDIYATLTKPKCFKLHQYCFIYLPFTQTISLLRLFFSSSPPLPRVTHKVTQTPSYRPYLTLHTEDTTPHDPTLPPTHNKSNLQKYFISISELRCVRVTATPSDFSWLSWE